jgi:hypothetical protein
MAKKKAAAMKAPKKLTAAQRFQQTVQRGLTKGARKGSRLSKGGGVG